MALIAGLHAGLLNRISQEWGEDAPAPSHYCAHGCDGTLEDFLGAPAQPACSGTGLRRLSAASAAPPFAGREVCASAIPSLAARSESSENASEEPCGPVLDSQGEICAAATLLRCLEAAASIDNESESDDSSDESEHASDGEHAEADLLDLSEWTIV